MKSPSMAKIDLKAFLDDFRNLNPKDVGAWPLAPRVAVLLSLFAAALVAGWWIVWNDQLDTLDARQQLELKLRDEFISKKKQAVNLDLYIQQLSEIDRSFGALLKQLPNKSEVESLLIEINQSGMGRGLQFELFKPGQEISKDFYAELPINVRLTGSYHDFGAFAGDIGRLSRIVTLNNISITTNPQAKDGSLVMDAVTKTFRYLDEEELAAKKKAAQAAKGGKK
ncbi:MAG: type 4a pilus biogenesis protein PilO [Propionivibrio sp.]|uniref:type 4a pilus biogenesis protein PilO n=2 Tax=Propionivibrio sp. TaxID=2212460 RepID=UPI0025ED719D|nr:type 4a pilus biogenesis protein PilO [Propionivibrio sp.]MBK7355036.1 type 4a pilus biogenesis protein PilO [Propionivibrio sp.]MBK8402406.1 type 4a pilus biogenesis protein PilO [Propionivibrio sp.]MBK8743560.1 type 4a pilus biogenesis protein PilO [Propionivibrio sp.]MBK8892864.1 type 4a pilus biogenesis protein PilO [Propionivibrio sp.]MBL0206473.1 type 4a pilus biogenesis protein PilO [Propionivibrio sp.]